MLEKKDTAANDDSNFARVVSTIFASVCFATTYFFVRENRILNAPTKTHLRSLHKHTRETRRRAYTFTIISTHSFPRERLINRHTPKYRVNWINPISINISILPHVLSAHSELFNLKPELFNSENCSLFKDSKTARTERMITILYFFARYFSSSETAIIIVITFDIICNADCKFKKPNKTSN